MGRAALGWRTHSGWAVVVAMTGSASDPVVLERRRVELIEGDLPRQPYHAAAEGGLALPKAEALIARVQEAAAAAAASVIKAMAVDAAVSGHTLAGVGVLAKDRNLQPALADILRSHPLLHAAEGELYEQAVVEGAPRTGLPVTLVAPGSEGGAGVDLEALAAAGKRAGPPWQKDHREAALAALAALVAFGGG